MIPRFLRVAVATALPCALLLCVATPAFADACDDARKAEADAREAMKNALNSMKAADAAAAAAPGNAAAQQAARRAEDAWLEANRNFRQKQAAAAQCPERSLESPFGIWRSADYAGFTAGVKFVQDMLNLGSTAAGAGGAIGFPTPGTVLLHAAQGSARGGVMLSIVGEVELTRASGFTTPAFLGGLRGTLPLGSRPEFSLFGEVLFGIERCGECETNDFAMDFGFGTVYRRPQWDRLGIAAQVAFRMLPGVEFSDLQTRIVGGISYRLAR
jgi:hypothetical protein